MSNGLPHEEARNALEALALDALDASERAAVLAHVDGCSVCRHELAALQNTAAKLTYLVRPVPMSAVARDRVKERLMSRATAQRTGSHRDSDAVTARTSDPGPVSGKERDRDTPAKPLQILVPHPDIAPPQHSLPRSTGRGAWWFAAAATLVAAVSLASLYKVNEERGAAAMALKLASADNARSRGVVDSLRANLASRDRMIANLTGPDVAVMTLASTGPNPPSARMFWNQSANAWTLVVHHLPKPLPGRTYQLWFVTKNQKISAGTFASGANGDAVMQATYTLPKDAQLAALAVTDEPEAGSAQPTTTPVLLALASAR